jgi:hypothetical protein
MNTNRSYVLDSLVRLCATHDGEERILNFPAPGGRPSINYYSRDRATDSVEFARGKLSVRRYSESGLYACELTRTDGGRLTRPISSTGFGDPRKDDPSGTVARSIIGHGESLFYIDDCLL